MANKRSVVSSTAQPWRPGMLKGLLLLWALTTLVACQTTPTPQTTIIPPYLRLQLCEGTAAWQPAGAATAIPAQNEVTITEKGQLSTGATGARFCFADGSTLSLDPDTEVVLQNPRIIPRLQITLQQGRVLFEAQGPSYELLVPACALEVLNTPSRLELFKTQQTTHLRVYAGALSCTRDKTTLNLFSCWELVDQPTEEPTRFEFCNASATATALALTPSPTLTPPGFRPSPTPVPPASTPTPTPTPTRQPVTPRPTATTIPVTPPTATPASDSPPTEPPPPPPPLTTPPPVTPPPTTPPPTTPPPTTPPPTTEPPTERPTPGGI